MNTKQQIIRQLESVRYIDMHIHMDEFSGIPDPSIMYIANSMDIPSYKKIVELSKRHKNIIPCFGIHPASVLKAENIPDEYFPGRISDLFKQNLLIGEIGLDYFWIEDNSTYSAQRKWLDIQLDFAAEHGSIPMLHTKGAESEILEKLKEKGIKKSLIHWYSGPTELIPDFLDLGCYFTIGPDIKRGSEVYKHIPADRMLAETDNPTGVPWITGQKAKNDDIKMIYQAISEKLNIPVSEIEIRFKQLNQVAMSVNVIMLFYS